ncbi:SusC/RagA family TonB-linked outer membrane protein [Macellibacteroides fermentans]|uniref:TonB-linked SusC/RagA family outer membrane protein n=1 Tax=Macellibacteroides fermentans TaxID=879969 RepID=A0A8E1ZX00_9PORP|nr:SusC/RagA family TonB-linked outer membrane protein [Macellibacteroides fermentans]NYI49047.1 TonB-linked SusC/RagA family outer membrane protein [Macellibacteroides fermentans]
MNFYRLKSISFIIFSCFLLQTVAFAQSGVKITINKKNITLQEALQEVEKQSGYMVAFNESKLEKTEQIDLNLNKVFLEKALTTILARTGFSYKIKDKYIMIVPQVKPVAEKKKITGMVKDEKGEPLIGVNVSIKGSSSGTITNIDGEFSLQAAKGEVIDFSYIGFASKFVTVGDGATIHVVLQEDAKALDEVVVTALGIKRSEKALSYNVQQVKSDAVNAVKDPNFVNGLTGKVAGVTINRSSSGIGGATRVIMRGAKSIVGNNNVLYVVDGMPIGNSSKGEIGSDYSSPAGGEGISDFNPEDIESISVLTGPAAAALYGSSAANGVILINTKKGEEGKLKVTITNNTEFMTPSLLPQFQNQYGNVKGSFKSWGELMEQSAKFNPRDFFQTGANIMNAANLSVGNKNNQTFVSVATTNSEGVIPNNEYYRYNFTVRNTASMLNNKLNLDLGASYILQGDQNMLSAGRYFNPLVPLYLFPRGEDFEAVKIFERYDATRKFAVQEWPYGDQGLSLENPYWIVNREMFPSNKKRYMFYANAKYDVFNWLNVAARIRVDNTNTTTQKKFYASTLLLFAQSPKGFYSRNAEEYQQTYADVMVNVNKNFGSLHLTGNVGFSYEDHLTTGLGIGGKLFTVPNLFSANNFDPSSGPGSQQHRHTRNDAIFGSAEFGYKNMLYLTLTGRQEWASQLVNSDQPTYFYPSAGLSGIISEMVTLPEFISFWKLRTSYAKVGAPINYTGLTPGTITDPMKGGTINPISIYPFPNFKAEQTKSYELGTQIRFFNKVNLDATLYLTDTYNQTFLSEMSPASGYSGFYVQAGKVRNKGVELSLSYNEKLGPIGYSSSLTYTANRNKIIRMVHDYQNPFDGELFSITELTLQDKGAYLREGDAIGDVYVKGILARGRDGKLIEEGSGYQVDRSQRIKVGSVNPDFSMGWRHNINWNNFSLDVVFNGRFGGIVTSTTQAFLDDYGVSKDTYDARQNGGVMIDGNLYDAHKYYSTIGGEQLMAYYTYSATNIRLQEANLTYSFPKKWFRNYINKLSVSAIGRNLLMIYNKAPFDPEMTSSTGTYSRGDTFMTPSLRNIGFSIKIEL